MGKLKLIKGELGEELVSKEIEKDTSFHQLINNLIVLDRHGMSHQIDHILIRSNGVFVLETKNIFGEINGKEEDSSWTKTIKKGNKLVTSKFHNPLKQNAIHIRNVKEIIGDKYPIYCFIVFVQNNIHYMEYFNILDLKDLNNRLNLITIDTPLTKEDINNIYLKLMSKMSEMSDKEHLDNVKRAVEGRNKYQNDAKTAIEKRICPKCGNNLILKRMWLICPNCGYKFKY